MAMSKVRIIFRRSKKIKLNKFLDSVCIADDLLKFILWQRTEVGEGWGLTIQEDTSSKRIKPFWDWWYFLWLSSVPFVLPLPLANVFWYDFTFDKYTNAQWCVVRVSYCNLIAHLVRRASLFFHNLMI